MHAHKWMRGLVAAAFLLASSGVTHAQDARALRAEIKMLRETEKRLNEAKKALEKRVAELEAENKRLKDVVAKTVPVDKRGPVADASCYLISVKGAIGTEFSSAMMKKYLAEAADLSPTAVVLEIDTPGGSIKDAEEIVDMIIEYKGLRFVAFVHKAISAGSTITLACKEVYVTDQAVIGAATAWYRQGGVLPTALAEKQMSIWRAMGRKAAENGGHSKLFAEAMVDPGFVLTMRKRGDEIVIERDGRGEVLKAKGKILTLTAKEAVKSGLAKKSIADVDALARELNLTGWKVTRAAGEVDKEPTGPVKVTRGDFTPTRLHAKMVAKADELGFIKGNMTQLQVQQASKEFTEWLEKEDIKEHKVHWTLKMVNAREDKTSNARLRQAVTAAKARETAAVEQYNQAKRARYRSRSEKKRAVDEAKKVAREAHELLEKYEKAYKEANAYPVTLYATAVDNAQVFVLGRFHKDDLAALGGVKPKEELTLDGEVSGLTFAPTPLGQRTPLLVLTKCRLAK